jgi:hypothetical protein
VGNHIKSRHSAKGRINLPGTFDLELGELPSVSITAEWRTTRLYVTPLQKKPHDNSHFIWLGSHTV